MTKELEELKKEFDFHECSDDCQCCEDYIHICDLDNFIKDLGGMKKVGVEFFKGKIGEEYWKPTTQQSLDGEEDGSK